MESMARCLKSAIPKHLRGKISMKRLYFFLLIQSQISLAGVDSKLKKIMDGHAKEIAQIIGTTVSSCAEKVVTNPSDLGLASQEISNISIGIASVLSEKLITLALKKDYPNACHVLTKKFLSSVEESEEDEEVCLIKIAGRCLQKTTQRHPVFNYYWPKYFIEVSQKGNDPYPAFAAENALFAANRKIANMISSFVDLQGPYTLLAKVVGVSSVTSVIQSTMNVDMKAGPGELGQAMKSAILLPFEKLRLRANDDPDMPSYEVNIWPVGLSQTMAKNLSVCEKGGFEWKLQGVPMTCPVAMARDAWSIWDTGLIDYLNPNAIRGMATSSNPVACITDQAASLLLDSSKSVSDSLGQSDQASSLISNLPNSYRGLGMCSFPILGSTEAIISQTMNVTNSFAGPWCTLWGPLVPRASTHIYKTDYGFANAALKFKLLAHDIFGVPRGAKEKWSLAYPWEESPNGLFGEIWHEVLSFLNDLDLAESVVDRMVDSDDYVGRSYHLMPPGDPRLIDASYNTQSLITEGKNLAKELAYLASLRTASSLAEQATQKAFAKENNIDVPTSHEILTAHSTELDQVTDNTARLDEEAVYEKHFYCHKWGEDQGLFTRNDAQFQLNYLHYDANDFSQFQRAPNAEHCHGEVGGNCLSRHKVTRKCIRPESIFYISLEKWEIVRYQKVQNPKRYVVDKPVCSKGPHHKPNSHTHQRHHYCTETLRLVGEKDTRDYADKPSPSDPERTIGKGSEAGKIAALAAKAAPWVGAELARAKFEDILGRSLLPGKKRVYTIFENISCRASDSSGAPVFKTKIGPIWKWSSCESAVRYQIRKYLQQYVLRDICDSIFLDPLGKPFK